MGKVMAKKNYCSRVVQYYCTVPEPHSKCKFFRSVPSSGTCKFRELGRCRNERAWKEALEKQRAAEYSGTKLTA